MKTYYGTRCNLGGTIQVEEEDGSRRTLRHVVLHSPTGLEWGYGGSGPADTALSILADYFDEKPSVRELALGRLAGEMARCLDHHQNFKWAFIARAPREGFEITTEQIDNWLAAGAKK